jgi:uncharacterized phage protein gp47/JayE
MALNIKTTKEVTDNIVNSIQASLNQTIPLLPKSFIRVLSKAIAGVFVLLYKYGGFIFLQLFVKTASFEETTINGKSISPLLEWGRLGGVTDPTSATNAQLLIDIIVTNQVGSIPAGTQLIGDNNGVTYLLLSDVALNAATVQGTVKAVSDQQGGNGAGVIGNLDAGQKLSFANSLASINRQAAVVSQVVTGADAESVSNYRKRVQDRWAVPPQGGAYADYAIWGKETEGIINIYPYTSTCPGQVDVYCEATIASSGNPDGIPTTAQLQAVLNSINKNEAGLATRRPVTALVNTFAISRVAIDIRIIGLTSEDLSQTKSQIETALTNYLLSREPFIEGLSVPPKVDKITVTSIGGIVDDVVNSVSGTFSGVFISKDGFNTIAYTLQEGEKAKIGTVTYV